MGIVFADDLDVVAVQGAGIHAQGVFDQIVDVHSFGTPQTLA